MNNNIDNLRDNILESFQDIDYDIYVENKIDDDKLKRVYALVRSFIVESYENNDLSDEAMKYMSIIEMYVNEKKLFSKQLYEGFYNPFDDTDDNIQMKPVKRFNVSPKDQSVRIKNVKLHNNDVDGKICYNNGKMLAGKTFVKGDIIEKCPCELVSLMSLFSPDMRSIVFTVDEKKNIYAIPFGYAKYYRNSKEYMLQPNAKYEFDDRNPEPTIVISATRRIDKGSEIVLYSDETDFENEMKIDQFHYTNDNQDAYRIIKNYRVL